MSERDWRKPMRMVAVEHDASSTVVIGGREVLNANVSISQEDFERMRLGYLCQCGEPQEVPFPKHCGLCGFPMREQQLAWLQQAYQGTKWLGPRQSLEDEQEELAERLGQANELRQRGILLPERYYR